MVGPSSGPGPLPAPDPGAMPSARGPGALPSAPSEAASLRVHLVARLEPGDPPPATAWYDQELGFFGFEARRGAPVADSLMGEYVVYDVDAEGAILRIEVLCPESLCVSRTLCLPVATEEGACRVDAGGEFPELARETEFAWDPAARILHLRYEAPRPPPAAASLRTVRIASCAFLELDAQGRVLGLWLAPVGDMAPEGE